MNAKWALATVPAPPPPSPTFPIIYETPFPEVIYHPRPWECRRF